jgi:hypothetical protein
MKLELYIKRVYGVPRLYPACKLSQALVAIKGMPTLTARDIERLRAAGVQIVIYGENGEEVAA